VLKLYTVNANKIPPNLPLKREELDLFPSFLKEGWGGFRIYS